MTRPEKSFSESVYDIVAQIPAGCVLTYGQIAAMLGNPRAARQVSFALARAPLDRDLPCHRVVNRLGTLAPDHVFGGQDLQQRRLESEGVRFDGQGRIVLKDHLWWF